MCKQVKEEREIKKEENEKFHLAKVAVDLKEKGSSSSLIDRPLNPFKPC